MPGALANCALDGDANKYRKAVSVRKEAYNTAPTRDTNRVTSSPMMGKYPVERLDWNVSSVSLDPLEFPPGATTLYYDLDLYPPKPVTAEELKAKKQNVVKLCYTYLGNQISDPEIRHIAIRTRVNV